MDGYKVEVLTDILSGMQKDEFYLCRVKGDDTKAINLDEEAVKLLIDYYSKQNYYFTQEVIKMDKQKIENKLYDFFMGKMYTGEAEEIEDVKRFKDYLCTMDNGIVIDCTDGTQICLTIQTR